MISYIALATGTIVASCSYVLAGRLAGLSAVILWIAGTAYYFMAPFHSFRVSSSSDLSALALYGMIGLVLAKTAPSEKQSVRDELLVPRIEPLPRFSTDLKTVLTDLGSSEVGEGLMLETKFLYQQRLRCSHPDAVRVLSDVLAEVLVTGRPIRLSIASGKRPGVDLLFVDAHRVWPPPTHQAIAIGRGDDECLRMKFFGWPSQVTATWFDNGYSRIYQITFRDSPDPTRDHAVIGVHVVGRMKRDSPVAGAGGPVLSGRIIRELVRRLHSFSGTWYPIRHRALSAQQPSFGDLPIPSGRAGKDLKGGGNLLLGQSAKIAQLDHLGLTRCQLSEDSQGLIHSQDGSVGRGGQDRAIVEIYFERDSVPPARTSLASSVHQNPPHHLGRHGKELRAGLPFDLGHVHQPQVDLMYQSGGLEAIALGFISHVPASHEKQFRIDALRQPGQSSSSPLPQLPTRV